MDLKIVFRLLFTAMFRTKNFHKIQTRMDGVLNVSLRTASISFSHEYIEAYNSMTEHQNKQPIMKDMTTNNPPQASFQCYSDCRGRKSPASCFSSLDGHNFKNLTTEKEIQLSRNRGPFKCPLHNFASLDIDVMDAIFIDFM